MSLRLEDYALIGDTRTAALVGIDGSIDWLCAPRFDSAACFAALLGDDSNGRWRVAAKGMPRATRRRYLPGALVLETEWETETGVARVTDFMPVRGTHSGCGSPRSWHQRHGRDGDGARRPFRLRPTRALGASRWRRSALRVRTRIRCSCARACRLHGQDARTYADFTVSEGEFASFVLSWNPSFDQPREPPHAGGSLDATLDWWHSWCSRLRYDGEWQDDVRTSLMVLKALSYGPTGGIVAAPTTSLPEHIGGVRNWDYRYCWLRDAAFSLWALQVGGYMDEARAWRDWLLRVAAGDPDQLQVLYGVTGESHLVEQTLDWLPGYENSAPVRIGNGAVKQFQLDVYGEVLDALHLGRVIGMEYVRRLVGASAPPGAVRDRSLARARRRPVGGARAAPALHSFEGNGVGGARSRGTRDREVRP